jgi:hypothetical protein
VNQLLKDTQGMEENNKQAKSLAPSVPSGQVPSLKDLCIPHAFNLAVSVSGPRAGQPQNQPALSACEPRKHDQVSANTVSALNG